MAKASNKTELDPANYLADNWTQSVPYTGQRSLTVYRTNIAYLFLAVFVSLLGVAALIPLFVGWWELGRDVSFAPLEVAHAFGAALLAGLDSNARQGDIAKAVRERTKRVKYGVVDGIPGSQVQGLAGDGIKQRLVVDDAGVVRTPVEGDIYG